MMQNRRTQYYIDRNVQGTLMTRVALYWVFCVFSVGLIVVCWNTVMGPPRDFIEHFRLVFQQYATVFFSALVLLPIVLIDVARLSARFVGPVFRLRAAMKELADGQQTAPLSFRESDFWGEMAADFNRVAARVPQNMLGRPTEAMPPSIDTASKEDKAALARS
jgi:hypothetical protein